MRLKAAWAIPTTTLLLASCSIGTTGSNYGPATGPAGATVALSLTEQRLFGGELLAVEESSLLIADRNQLFRIDLRVILSGEAPKVSFRGGSLSADARRQLRLISRYPQGVSPTLEAGLLKAYGAPQVIPIS
jgi:hypothetical protein